MITIKISLEKLLKQLEKNLLPEDYIQSVKEAPSSRIDSIGKFYFNVCGRNDFEGLSTWESREIVAVIRHHCSRNLIRILKNAISFDEYVEKHGEDHYYYDYLLGLDERLLYDQYIEELARLDFIEEAITLGMLDLHEDSYLRTYEFEGQNLFGGVCYMIKHDFGKDAGIDFRMLRAQKVKDELIAHEVSVSEFWSLFSSES